MTSMMAARVEGAGANCQDRVALLPVADGVVAVVADGAGGTGGGAKAATQVIERVRQAVEQGRELNERGLRQLLLEIGVELEGGGIGQTTAVIVLVSASRLVGASVGDSGAWFVGSDAWRELTEGQPRKPLLGGGLAEPFTFSCEMRDGTLLLATDGVLKHAPADALHEVARRELRGSGQSPRPASSHSVRYSAKACRQRPDHVTASSRPTRAPSTYMPAADSSPPILRER